VSIILLWTADNSAVMVDSDSVQCDI